MTTENINKFNAWMPISKSSDGSFIGVLSDNSIDRDGEFMSKELLESWAMSKKTLPMLANHENKLEKLIGGWTEKKLISKGKSHALTAKPFFLESNPLGVQAKAMVEEALAKGLNIGISIGAIPSETIEKEIDGVMHRGFTKAEIIEATIVPVQSNRNASFSALAKHFDITEQISETKEVNTMTQEVTKDVAPVEETVKETPVEEKVEETPVVDEKSVDELESVKKELSELKKAMDDFKGKSVNMKGNFEHTATALKKAESAEDNGPLTIEKQLRMHFEGGQ